MGEDFNCPVLKKMEYINKIKHDKGQRHMYLTIIFHCCFYFSGHDSSLLLVIIGPCYRHGRGVQDVWRWGRVGLRASGHRICTGGRFCVWSWYVHAMAGKSWGNNCKGNIIAKLFPILWSTLSCWWAKTSSCCIMGYWLSEPGKSGRLTHCGLPVVMPYGNIPVHLGHYWHW